MLELWQICVVFLLVSVEVAGKGPSDAVESFTCIHDEVVHQPPRLVSVNKGRPTTDGLFKRQASGASYAPIRIVFDYSFLNLTYPLDPAFTCYWIDQTVTSNYNTPYNCTAGDVLTAEKVATIRNDILRVAQTRIQSIVSVEPVAGNLRLARENCFRSPLVPGFAGQTAIIPEKYATTGVAADLVVLVTARPIPVDCLVNPAKRGSPCDTTVNTVLAFAGDCQSDDETDRPIAGYLNFNPQNIPTGGVSEPVYMTAVHELHHVLGFSSSKYKFYGRFVGSVWQPWGESAVTVNDSRTATGGKSIVTANVRLKAQQLFNCPTLLGAPLEDGGGGGTEVSHWERTSFMNEFMTGRASSNPVWSSLTLALLEDTGWYKVDYTSEHVEPLVWGYKLGCDFVRGCQNWPSSSPYLCTSASQSSCTFDRTAKGGCYTFAPGAAGDVLTGTCQYYQAYSNGYCNDGGNRVAANTGEQYCDTCRCFDSTLLKKIIGTHDKQQLCYQTTCAGPNRLKIRVDGTWFSCGMGNTLTPSGYNGEITCPNDNLLCLGVADDPTWPEFISMTPSDPQPGDKITIKGRGFTTGSTIKVYATCSEPTFVDNETYTCVLAGWDVFSNPSVVGAQIDLVLTDNQGKNAVGFNVLRLVLPFDFLTWLKDNPLYTALISAGVLLICVVICVLACCRRDKKKKARVKQEAVEEIADLETPREERSAPPSRSGSMRSAADIELKPLKNPIYSGGDSSADLQDAETPPVSPRRPASSAGTLRPSSPPNAAAAASRPSSPTHAGSASDLSGASPAPSRRPASVPLLKTHRLPTD